MSLRAEMHKKQTGVGVVMYRFKTKKNAPTYQ